MIQGIKVASTYNGLITTNYADRITFK